MIKNISLPKILLLALGVRLGLMFISGFHPDLPNHLDWGDRFLQLGPQRFYENIFWGVSWPNQPYGTILLFGLMAKLNQIIFSFFWYLNTHIPAFPSAIIPFLVTNLHVWLVKLPFILCDLGLGYLIYRIVLDIAPRYARLAAAIFLFNPLVIYNSTIWGQTDSLINLLSLTGLYLTFKRRYFWGPLLFLSSYIFKVSLIIYLPVFGILLLQRWRDIPKYLPSCIAFIIMCYLLAIPFSVSVGKTPFDWIRYMYENRVLPRQGNMLNGNAFNLWYLIFGFDFAKSELMTLGAFTAKQIGMAVSILLFVPILIKTFLHKQQITTYLSAMMLLAFISFTFLTNIHERYLYPIFPILTILLFVKNSHFKLWHYIILSLLHLLNLYNLWFYPLIQPVRLVLLYDNFIVCRGFALLFFVICASYYVQYLSDPTKAS